MLLPYFLKKLKFPFIFQILFIPLSYSRYMMSIIKQQGVIGYAKENFDSDLFRSYSDIRRM